MSRLSGWGQRSAALGSLVAIMLGGCSTVMEAQRPDPVDLHRYAVGQRRIEVLSRLGPPASTLQDGPNSCDVYKLYTNGVSRVGKGAIIFTEAAADFFTLGLAEVVATPGEAATKNKLHTVLACYAPDQTLVSLMDEGRTIMTLPAVAGASVTGAPTPAFVPAPAPATVTTTRF